MRECAGGTRNWRALTVVAVAVLALFAGGACGDDGDGDDSGAGKTITVGVLPFLDYQAWYVAHELGLDEDLGYDLEFKTFPLEPDEIRALARGDLDIGQGAIGSLIPQLPQRSDLRVVLSEAQFRGFAFVARKGDYKTFDQLLDETGDENAARAATLEQFDGQNVVTLESSFKATIAAALESVGLSYDDIEVTNFNQSAAAAIAYIRGEGDVFMGGLPETVKLVKKNPDDYEVLIGAENMGPPGLWFSNAFVSDAYLRDNRDQLLDLTAIWYRTMRYLKEQPEKAYPIMINELNSQSSSEFTQADLEELIPDFTFFPTSDEASEQTFAPDASGYWRKATDFLVAQNETQGTIDAGSVDVSEFVVQEDLFKEFLNDKELVEWVEAPLD